MFVRSLVRCVFSTRNLSIYLSVFCAAPQVRVQHAFRSCAPTARLWTTRRRGAGSAHRSSGIGEITSPVTSNCLRSLSWCEIAPGRQPAAPMPAQHCTRPRRVHSCPLCTRVRQLLSGAYAVGPRSLHCGGFGLLCGCGALIGLAAAHTCSRPLLYLVRRSPHAHRALIPRLLPFTHAYTPLGAWATCTLLVTSNPNPTLAL